MKFFTDIINYWKNDWKENRTLFWLEIIGVILALAAATVLSLKGSAAPMLSIFCIYSAANCLFIIASKIRSASWMILLNLAFLVLNIAGIINSLLY